MKAERQLFLEACSVEITPLPPPPPKVCNTGKLCLITQPFCISQKESITVAAFLGYPRDNGSATLVPDWMLLSRTITLFLTGCYRVFIKYCVLSKILIYFPDPVFSRCQCVYTRRAGRTPALQQNWQSSEN